MSYDPSYSFANHQALNPSSPLPGNAIDVELAAIAKRLQELGIEISDIRRGDGRLNNDTVTWESLSSDVRRTVSPPKASASIEAILSASTGLRTAAGIYPGSIATENEASVALANDRFMTPLRTGQAVTALRPFASQAEAQEATATNVVVSPAGVGDAIGAKRPFATDEQARLATATESVLSPATGNALLDAKRRAISETTALTWGAIAAGTAASQAITMSGAVVGDRVALGMPAAGPAPGLVPVAWVSAPDTVTLRFQNVSAGSLTPFDGLTVDFSVTVIGF